MKLSERSNRFASIDNFRSADWGMKLVVLHVPSFSSRNCHCDLFCLDQAVISIPRRDRDKSLRVTFLLSPCAILTGRLIVKVSLEMASPVSTSK